ncbi:hypothetical protein HQQ81_18545 [Microbacteriaceae bacterium VKM Ac-2854]|nr:hypothetical protein [Microbacteriaceae bacterium VKM Ac-2854]
MNDAQLILILNRDLPTGQSPSTLRRSSDLIVVRRGVRVEAKAWAAASPLARFRARVDAVVATRSSPLLLRESAAVIWRLPLVESPPQVIDVQACGADGSRRRAGIAEHRSSIPPLVDTIGGYRVSSFAQTVFDLSRFASFRRAVVAADHALRRVGSDGAPLLRRDELRELLEALPLGAKGHRKSAAVIAFADPRAESPLESISRVGMHLAGIPAPVLQQRIPLGDGRNAYLDFAWPALGAVGEADGRFKYTDPAFLQGRTAEHAVYDEKRREDAIRSITRGFARWSWDDAYAVTPMLAELAKAGVKPGTSIVQGNLLERVPRNA